MTLSATPSRAVALAETINGALEDRFLGASSVRVRGALDVRQVVLDELAIDGLAGVGPVLISGCRFGTLRLTDVAIREGVIIEDCDIGSLEVRGGRNSTFSLLRSGIRRCVLHECGTLVIDSTTVTELAAISDTQTQLELARSAVGSLRVSADGPTQLSEVRVFATTVRDRLDLVGLDGDRLHLRDVAAARAQIRNVRFDFVQLRELSIERDLGLQALAGKGGAPSVEVGGVIGSGSITIADERGADVLFREATVRGDLTLGGRGAARVEESCAVEGMLRFSQGPHATSVRLSPGANVRAVQPPVAPVRTPRQARGAASNLLGGAGVTELAILCESLHDRPDEQDMAYFALREAEQDEASGVRRATMWLRGQFFGWGVTFLHPLRTFFGAVLVTAAVVFALNPAKSGGLFVRAVDALTAALGLWFNVGTGMPDELDGPGWALAAVACTALGIAIITVLTGVAIRRLTR